MCVVKSHYNIGLCDYVMSRSGKIAGKFDKPTYAESMVKWQTSSVRDILGQNNH